MEFLLLDPVRLHFLPYHKFCSKSLKIVLNKVTDASAYDPAPWIFALIGFTRSVYLLPLSYSSPLFKSLTNERLEIYTQHTHIKLFGSCFGHQLICHALFSTPNHRAVSRDPKGWELGVHPITLSKAFFKHFGPV